MSPDDIKAELVRRRVKQSDIAKEAGLSPVTVNDVIHGRRHNPNVKRIVAGKLGKPVKKVFPEIAA